MTIWLVWQIPRAVSAVYLPSHMLITGTLSLGWFFFFPVVSLPGTCL